MSQCSVDRCEEEITKKGHTLCHAHWKAQQAGELGNCEKCRKLTEQNKPLCLSCYRAQKGPIGADIREAGQGAREKADELAKKNPLRSIASRLTLGLISSPDHSWRTGAASEAVVGKELSRLSKRWFVRHDIMIAKNWNADHVVAGPPGVFVLDTKFRSGEVVTTKSGIRVDGRKTQMAEKVQDQAREISKRLRDAAGLRSWVQPVLVFDNDVRGRREPEGVHVVDVVGLVEYLEGLPQELDAATVARVGKAMLDNATWAL